MVNQGLSVWKQPLEWWWLP